MGLQSEICFHHEAATSNLLTRGLYKYMYHSQSERARQISQRKSGMIELAGAFRGYLGALSSLSILKKPDVFATTQQRAYDRYLERVAKYRHAC